MHGFLVSTLFKAIRNEHSDLCATEDWVPFLWCWGKTTNLVDVAASDIFMTHLQNVFPSQMRLRRALLSSHQGQFDRMSVCMATPATFARPLPTHHYSFLCRTRQPRYTFEQHPPFQPGSVQNCASIQGALSVHRGKAHDSGGKIG